jgi:hypothetical protein
MGDVDERAVSGVPARTALLSVHERHDLVEVGRDRRVRFQPLVHENDSRAAALRGRHAQETPDLVDGRAEVTGARLQDHDGQVGP